MSAVSARRARVGAAVDRAFGESFLLSPRRRPEGDPDARPVADTSRQAFSFVGRFLSKSADQHARSRSTSLQETKAFNTAVPTVTVMKESLLCDVAELDLVTHEETGDVFTVTKAKDGQFGRLVLTLRSGPR